VSEGTATAAKVWEDIIDEGARKEQTEYIEQTARYKYKSLIYKSDWQWYQGCVKYNKAYGEKMVVGQKAG
jgi:hypothetical protein